jgi:ribosome biogenesis protein Tsr3
MSRHSSRKALTCQRLNRVETAARGRRLLQAAKMVSQSSGPRSMSHRDRPAIRTSGTYIPALLEGCASILAE